ncbi:MAG: hypothetical protein AAFN08_09910, partial [Cyanobacteria bacterium J06559_3]
MTPHSGTLSTTSQSAPEESFGHTESLKRRRWRRYAWGLLPFAIAPVIIGGYYLRSAANDNPAPKVAEALPVDVI